MPDVGYRQLLAQNRNFRRLWLGDMASMLGDWFNTIALYSLVAQLTGSPFALGLTFLTKMLPFAIASPFAGWLVDRLDRRRLMLAADLARAVVVAGFLLVDDPSDVPLLYALVSLQMMLSAVFLPARSAVIPSITSARELVTANALAAATWSTLLAVGAALGGFAAEVIGNQGVFIFDSATYLVSAFAIAGLRVPPREHGQGGRMGNAWTDILAGWRHLLAHPPVGRIALAKSAWAIGGGALVFLLTLLGERWMPDARSVGMGLLFGARGLGTGLGPVLGRALARDPRGWPRLLGRCIVGSALAYLAIGLLPFSLASVALVAVAHAASGTNWVFSTVLLQQRTTDAFRGRVFATEWLLVTLADTVAILAASLALEHQLLDLDRAVCTFAAIQLVAGVVWLLLVVPRERRSD